MTDPKTESTERLPELVEALRREIESRSPLSDELRQRLDDVLDELREAIEAEEGEREDEPSALLGRIEDIALEFEAEHPTIAGTLNRLTHLLSSMGI